MDSRERVFLALDHKEPDRIPIDCWTTKVIDEKLMNHYGFTDREQLLQKFDVDFRYIEGPKYIGPEPATHDDGSIEDHWGVPRVLVEIEGADGTKASYREVLDFPLRGATSVQELIDYPKWPDPDWFDYDCVAEQVAEARKTGKVIAFMGDRMNRCAQLKPAMYLRGIDQIFYDLAIDPDIAEYLFRRISEFYIEYFRRVMTVADGGIDIMFLGDDFGTQKGPFMSPEMWRKFLRPGFKQYCELGHEFGAKVAHHSCGSIKALIPELIECGLDILNPIQPDVTNMDHAEVKKLYGDQLCFHGSISIQKTLPFGTPEDIRNEVRNRFETLGPNGGFIFCSAHNIQADTPIENIEALFEAYHEYGRY
ncbi:MAG: uroporphyrinogen decarboxylase family protein [Planctomycetia bacterium]|jgi:uroporphyrinogen decarboxylase